MWRTDTPCQNQLNTDLLLESAEKHQLLEKGGMRVSAALTSLTKMKRKNEKGKVMY